MSNGPAQTFEIIPVSALLERAGTMHKQGYRLVQIGATRLPEQIELTYSFDRDSRLANLRLHLPATAARVPSISGIYWCAFVYENEVHDLFGVQVDGMAVDFHGHFYETAVKFPFGTTKVPVAKPAAAPPVANPPPAAAKH
ncbi:MAG TPA: NADH-quinone oxidoreductase subunit C [Candidatus Paceibacterota bacterium]|nr:NADH-quinone oxidoreductase subunit C [Verrucomicrobiota bacterium]HSA10324.1 NADH-quinone oxidoreductase subunit C [Candidatus Paceibacterota bacterium]